MCLDYPDALVLDSSGAKARSRAPSLAKRRLDEEGGELRAAHVCALVYDATVSSRSAVLFSRHAPTHVCPEGLREPLCKLCRRLEGRLLLLALRLDRPLHGGAGKIWQLVPRHRKLALGCGSELLLQ